MGQSPIRVSGEQVGSYYDDNTARFERYGQGGTAIHRAVWGPGVQDRSSAFHYVDDLILHELDSARPRPKVFDLGCGLGASLSYLSARREITGEGITLSAVQATRARELIEAAGLARLVRCRQGDFLTLPADMVDADLAFSIEAFVHSSDARGYFHEAARVLRTGGKLVVCDDFVTDRPADKLTDREQRWLAEFRQGWRLGSLVTIEHAARLAEAAGLKLVQNTDLTPYLELRRPRDRFLGIVVAIGRHLPLRGEYWLSIVGGEALQHALLAGVINYRALVFQRV